MKLLYVFLVQVALAASYASALDCFCNEPYFGSSCLSDPDANSTAPMSYCVAEQGGCCYKHLNKKAVPSRRPAGDMRSDFYGCYTALQCIVGKIDTMKDTLLAVCEDEDYCNHWEVSQKEIIRTVEATVQPHLASHILNMVHVSRISVIVIGCVMGGLVILVIVLVSAYIIYQKRKPVPALQHNYPASNGNTDMSHRTSTMTSTCTASRAPTPSSKNGRITSMAESEEVTFENLNGA